MPYRTNAYEEEKKQINIKEIIKALLVKYSTLLGALCVGILLLGDYFLSVYLCSISREPPPLPVAMLIVIFGLLFGLCGIAFIVRGLFCISRFIGNYIKYQCGYRNEERKSYVDDFLDQEPFSEGTWIKKERK